MRLLIVGQQKDWALEHHYIRYLSGHATVEVYPAEEVFDDFYWKSKLNKIIFRLGLSGVQEKIAEQLLAKAEAFQPDIIWVFKGMRLLPSILNTLKQKGFKLANYNPDHPFVFSSRGSGNKNITDSIGLYDLHLCYDPSVAKKIELDYAIKTAILPFGYDLPEETFEQIQHTPEIKKACFIGNPDPIRVEHLKALTDNGVQMDVYGHGWGKHLRPSNNLRAFDAVYKRSFWEKMRAYRVQINIFRLHNEGSHNMRTFEIPAVGGIMLAPDNPQHRSFFEINKEAFFYKNTGELIDKAQYILNLPKQEADALRHNARQRSIHAGYDYKSRTAQAAQAFHSILGNNRSYR